MCPSSRRGIGGDAVLCAREPNESLNAAHPESSMAVLSSAGLDASFDWAGSEVSRPTIDAPAPSPPRTAGCSLPRRRSPHVVDPGVCAAAGVLRVFENEAAGAEMDRVGAAGAAARASRVEDMFEDADFEVAAGGRSVLLRAASSAERDEWSAPLQRSRLRRTQGGGCLPGLPGGPGRSADPARGGCVRQGTGGRGGSAPGGVAGGRSCAGPGARGRRTRRSAGRRWARRGGGGGRGGRRYGSGRDPGRRERQRLRPGRSTQQRRRVRAPPPPPSY